MRSPAARNLSPCLDSPLKFKSFLFCISNHFESNARHAVSDILDIPIKKMTNKKGACSIQVGEIETHELKIGKMKPLMASYSRSTEILLREGLENKKIFIKTHHIPRVYLAQTLASTISNETRM
ncbi:MAG: hypothetical protein PHC50_02695 [Candidatus Cloacimonetes bacterium]|nr:hypothetical protein [Candidatus Cloacimonadota bacterium]